MIPTNFHLVVRGMDLMTRLPLAYVACEHIDHQSRLVVYKLVKREGHWYHHGFWSSAGRFIVSPEPKGRKLSDSQLDQTLIAYAEA